MLCLGSLCSFIVSAGEWRGLTGIEYRHFTEQPLYNGQHNNYTSLVLNPEYYFDWNAGKQSVTFSPFYRRDQYDDNRTHADIRELYWLYVGDNYEIAMGIRKLFWGTTESQHLVDIVNQTDLVEHPDGEDKLGQPMVSGNMVTGLGRLAIVIMPYFRERTFPGEEGRLRSSPRIDTREDALYEHRDKNRHLDWAARWSHSLGSWDMGVTYFYGTNREPQVVPAITASGEAVLLPYYELAKQAGIDIQGASGAWLWKLEAIRHKTTSDTFSASTTGFEYTFYSVFDSGVDTGLVAEYLHDSRKQKATTPFEDDVMLGLRLNPNDAAGTEFLFGVIGDRHSKARLYSLESSRRLTPHVKVSIEALVFSRAPVNDPAYYLRQDDFIQASLLYYF